MIEENDFIQYCMSRLSEKEREFVRLRYYDELTQDKIAKKWGVSQIQISRFEKTLLKKLNRMYLKDWQSKKQYEPVGKGKISPS